MAEVQSLSKAEMHKECTIENVIGSTEEKIRLFDLGFSPKSRVTPLYRGMGGGTTAFLVKGTLIAIRQEESEKILIKTCSGGDDSER